MYKVTSSRRAISKQIIAVGVVVLILVVGVAGYFLLGKGTTTSTGSGTTNSSCGALGFARCNPVSGVQLYNVYGLSGIPRDDKTFTNQTIYVVGNLTSIINYPKPQLQYGGSEEETGVNTGGNDFEYWYWGNTTGLPSLAENQQVFATCHDMGLFPYGNGSSLLYLDQCGLISSPTG
jgi:hypothetical protein